VVSLTPPGHFTPRGKSMRYPLNRRLDVPKGKRVFCTRKLRDQLLGPASLLFNGYRSTFPDGWLSRHDVEHLPLSSAEVKNEWSFTSTPLYVFTTWTRIALLLLTFHIRVKLSVVRI